MKKTISLIDHNIEQARSLTIESGRFKGTVCLSIGGTVGRMTVSAEELMTALQETVFRRRQDAKAGEKSNKKKMRAASSQGSSKKTSASSGPPRDHRRVLTISGRPSTPVHVSRLVTTSEMAQTRFRPGAGWTLREDRVISVVSPQIASEKLKRPLTEILARRRELGLPSR
jgi:hypothetical protein